MRRKQTFYRVRLKAEAVWETAEPAQPDPERAGPAHRALLGVPVPAGQRGTLSLA